MTTLTSDDRQLRLAVLLMAERLTCSCIQHNTPCPPPKLNTVELFQNWYRTAWDLLNEEDTGDGEATS